MLEFWTSAKPYSNEPFASEDIHVLYDGKYDRSPPGHVYDEYVDAFRREEKAWSAAAFGVDNMDEVDVTSLEQLTRRLCSGDLDEKVLGLSLLSKCRKETATII